MTYDKLAYMTFTAPVQIPGATLNAGTYTFRLANPDTSRNVLQVLSGDGTIVYAMFHTIPDFRTVLTEEPAVTFRETPAGVPPAVKTLFYGGEYHGYAPDRFVVRALRVDDESVTPAVATVIPPTTRVWTLALRRGAREWSVTSIVAR